VPEFAYTVTMYDPDRPWIVASREHGTVQLADGVDFGAWARQQYPDPQTTVQLDPQTQQPWPRA